MAEPRKPKTWDSMIKPRLLPVTGFRDQLRRVTFLPWSDAESGYLGWEMIHDSMDKRNMLVYLYLSETTGEVELRCYYTDEEPDPLNDRLLGTVTIPDDL